MKIYSDCGTDNCLIHSIPCNHNPDGTVCDVCNQFPEVESQIESLHSRLKELHERHRTIRTKRNDVSDIISRFPFDIASLIFVLCLPQTNQFSPYESTCRSTPTAELPFILSAVCRSWRRIVYSTPRLWSTLSIDIDKANLQHVNHRFHSSRSAPLRVQLHAWSRKGDTTLTSAHIPDIIALVKQNLHRIALLCLHLPCHLTTKYLSQGLDTSPILEEFHIHCPLFHCPGYGNSFLHLRPKKLLVTPSSLMNTQLDWSHIRHFCLGDGEYSPMVAQALSLLAVSKQLHVVDLRVKNPEYLVPLPVTQNSIRNLRLFLTPINTLSQVTMPHLESLTLWETPCNSTSPLISFLQRSACPLKAMIWKPCDPLPVEQTFIKVFQYTPDLREVFLSLDQNSVSSEKQVVPFLEHLGMTPTTQIRDPSSDSLLPLLHRFIYTGPMTHVPLGHFLDIVESRTLSAKHGQVITRPLQALCIYRPDKTSEPPTEPELQRILQLNAAGKTVSVIAYNSDIQTMVPDFAAQARLYYD